jgi:hypothetical protein
MARRRGAAAVARGEERLIQRDPGVEARRLAAGRLARQQRRRPGAPRAGQRPRGSRELCGVATAPANGRHLCREPSGRLLTAEAQAGDGVQGSLAGALVGQARSERRDGRQRHRDDEHASEHGANRTSAAVDAALAVTRSAMS